MASYEEVLTRLEGEGVRVERKPDSLVVRFPPSVSRYDLVGHTADIMSSEKLPFNGIYAITNDGEDVVLDLDNHPLTKSS